MKTPALLIPIVFVFSLVSCSPSEVLDSPVVGSSPTLSRTDSALLLLDSLSKPKVINLEKEVVRVVPGKERIKTVTQIQTETVYVDREVVADAVVRSDYAPRVDTVYIREAEVVRVAETPSRRRRALIQIVKRVVDTVYVRDTVYMVK